MATGWIERARARAILATERNPISVLTPQRRLSRFQLAPGSEMKISIKTSRECIII